MGEIRVQISLVNEWDALRHKHGLIGKDEIRSAEVNALVDTGAVMILLPQDLVETLGLSKIDHAIVSLANEEKMELDVAGPVSITVANRRWMTDCLVGPPQCEALVGQLVLERLDLIIDPLMQTLTPRPESPYLPSLRLK